MTIPIKILTVDPGISGSGWALFNDGEHTPLCTGYHIPKGKDWEGKLENLIKAFDKVFVEHNHITAAYIEWPAFWSTSQRSIAAVNSGALLKLAAVCGGIYAISLSHDADVFLMTPSQWKGQLPKTLVDSRIRKCLGRTYRDHESDAVGMGLFLMGVL